MKKLKEQLGQGMTEYILILGIIVAIAVGVFWQKLRPAVENKVGDVVQSISSKQQ